MENHPYAKEGRNTRVSGQYEYWTSKKRHTSADWRQWKKDQREKEHKEESQIHKVTGAKGSYEALTEAMRQQGTQDPEASGSGYGLPSTARTALTEDELDVLEPADTLCAKAVALREAAQLVPYQGMAWHVLLKESNRLTAIHNAKRHTVDDTSAQLTLLQIEYQTQMADLTRCWSERLKWLEQAQEAKHKLEKIESEIAVRTMARDKVAAQLYAVTKIHERIPRLPNPVYMGVPPAPATASEPAAPTARQPWPVRGPTPKNPTLAAPAQIGPKTAPAHHTPGTSSGQHAEGSAQQALSLPAEGVGTIAWCQRVLDQVQELKHKLAAGASQEGVAAPKTWLYPRTGTAGTAAEPDTANVWLSTAAPAETEEVTMEPPMPEVITITEHVEEST